MNKLVKYSFLLMTLSLVACGGGENPSVSENGSEEISSEMVSLYPDTELGENEYRVKVLLPNGEPCYSEGMYAQWCSGELCYLPVKVDANGYARTTLPANGSTSYSVHLGRVPEGYTYNPNAYEMSPEENDIRIILSTISDFLDGDGTKYVDLDEEGNPVDGTGPYITTEGVYNFEVTSSDDEIYMGFVPNAPGKYQIEAWAYDLSGVKTTLNYYGGNPEYVENILGEYKDGGLNGNFAYTLECKEDSFYQNEDGTLVSGSKHIFGLKAEGDNIYPFEFSLSISYVGKADPVVNETKTVVDMNATETLVEFANKPEGAKIKQIPMDGSVTVVYNQEDRFYHLNDVNGPEVLVKISKPCAYIDKAISEISTAQYGDQTYLLLDDKTKNYEPLVEQYAEVCNSDGVYPATEELKVMLKLIADKQQYFHPMYGYIAPQLDYEVAEENQWLFAAYYYELA